MLKWLRIEQLLCVESIDITETTDPMEPIERTDPIDPTEHTDPMDPTERIDPSEQTERNEPRDFNDNMARVTPQPGPVRQPWAAMPEGP